jgi:hypothetical protein
VLQIFSEVKRVQIYLKMKKSAIGKILKEIVNVQKRQRNQEEFMTYEL